MPNRALLAATQFVGAALLGTWLIVGGVYVPWLPMLLVGAYGLLLSLEIRREKLVPNDHINDSPYYLGFVLTFVALYAAFDQWSAEGSRDLDVAMPLLVRNMGAAILTSIVGLLIRYILVVGNPIEQRTEELILALQEEMRANVAHFKSAQQQLLQLIDDFTGAQEHLLGEQAHATSQYVATLEKSTTVLSDIQQKLVPEIETHGEILKSAVQNVGEVTRNVKVLADDLGQSKLVETFEFLDASAKSLRAQLLAFGDQCIDTSRVLQRMHGIAERTNADLEAVDALLEEFIKVASNRLRELARVKQNAVRR